MYIEASSPRKEGDYAHLASELFKVNPQFNWCVTFYYHMYGQSVGTLIVESQYRPSWGRGRRYYRTHQVIQGNQGDRWNWMQVDVTQSYDFQVNRCVPLRDLYSPVILLCNYLLDDRFLIKCPYSGRMVLI